MKMKKTIGLVMVLLSVSFVFALPDIYTGIKTIQIPDSASAGSGTIDLYIDGNATTTAGHLNDVLLNYSTPPNTQSSIFYFRVQFKGEGAVEHQADITSGCLGDIVQVKQSQRDSGTGNTLLETFCFDGSWTLISTISKINYGDYNNNNFENWFHSEIRFSISEKVTPASNFTANAGNVTEHDLGIIEEESSPDYAGIISQTSNTLTQYLEFLGTRIWESVSGTEILDFEVLATNVSDPDFVQVERGTLFLESKPGITIKTGTGTFQTFECSDGVNDGYITDSINGTSLLFVDAPQDLYLFSIYDSAL
jgi:hypothetical protein